ncbi:MAG: FliG C-terminal domain-containing protein [Pirellulaceae bacterium]
MTSQLPLAIRKAAVLIAALDERAADALLDQMGPEMSARVRYAVMEIGDVPAGEQQAVLAEFLRGKRTNQSSAARPAGEAGVELALSEPLSAAPTVEQASRALRQDPLRSFSFLSDVPPRETARVLSGEHPQTIAVVVALLEPHVAAPLLECLSPSLATDVLERLAATDPPAAEIVADIERQLRLDLAPFLSPAATRPRSLGNLQALLSAMDATARERVLAGLGERNQALSRELGYRRPAAALDRGVDDRQYSVDALRYRIERPADGSQASDYPTLALPVAPIEFDDLSQLGDDALRRVFAAADPQVVLLALTGADEALLARILRQLPAPAEATLRKRLNHPGAIRLSDIEQARQQLAELAGKLAAEGTIRFSGSRHFAAAA